jgi:YgiT-type zinc finger domain-containing protein
MTGMRCGVCKNGETKQGKSVITLTKGKLAVVFRNVPAEICHDCWEEYMSEDDTNLLLQTADESFKKGIEIDLKDWNKLTST